MPGLMVETNLHAIGEDQLPRATHATRDSDRDLQEIPLAPCRIALLRVPPPTGTIAEAREGHAPPIRPKYRVHQVRSRKDPPSAPNTAEAIATVTGAE